MRLKPKPLNEIAGLAENPKIKGFLAEALLCFLLSFLHQVMIGGILAFKKIRFTL